MTENGMLKVMHQYLSVYSSEITDRMNNTLDLDQMES